MSDEILSFFKLTAVLRDDYNSFVLIVRCRGYDTDTDYMHARLATVLLYVATRSVNFLQRTLTNRSTNWYY